MFIVQETIAHYLLSYEAVHLNFATQVNPRLYDPTSAGSHSGGEICFDSLILIQ